MADDRPTVLTVPTELDRQDWFIDGAILLFSAVVVAYLGNFGWQWWGLVFVPFIAIETLTGDPAGDVRGVGAIAAGLRSRLGLRRAHEWVLAFLYWWHLAVYPVWRSNCVAFSQSRRRQILRWHHQLSEATRWRVSQGCSWASAIRSSSFRRLKRST